MKRATNKTPKQLQCRQRERGKERKAAVEPESDSESEPAPEPRTELVPTKIYAFCRVYALCETKRQAV